MWSNVFPMYAANYMPATSKVVNVPLFLLVLLHASESNQYCHQLVGSFLHEIPTTRLQDLAA